MIEEIPGILNIETWGEPAFWNASDVKGAAQRVWIWNCDFATDPGYSLSDTYANRQAHFAAHDAETPYAPGTAGSGLVWCDMDLKTGGFYLFTADVPTYIDAQLDVPGYEPIVEFCIDDTVLGQQGILPGMDLHSFVLNLSAGTHRFIIKQISEGFFFTSLSAWPIQHVVIEG